MRAKCYKIHGEHLQNVLTGFSKSCPNFILSKEISTSKIKGQRKIRFTALQNRIQNYSFICVEVYSYLTLVVNFHLIEINADLNIEFMSGHSAKASSQEQKKVEMFMSNCDIKGSD